MAVVPILAGVPGAFSLLVTGSAMIVLPLAVGRRFEGRWNRETPIISATYPSAFLAKVKGIKRTGYFIMLGAVLLAVTTPFTHSDLASFFASSPLALAFLYIWAVELVLIQTQLNFWAPRPFYALRACLLSEFDEKRAPTTSWLDDSLTYFSRLSARSAGLTLRDDLSLDAILFGSQFRRLSISKLLRYLDSENVDYVGFVKELSEMTNRPVTDIVEKAGLTVAIRRNQTWILGSLAVAVPVLIALSPYIVQYSLDPIFQSWSQLFHSLH